VLHERGREKEWCGERRGTGSPYIEPRGLGRAAKTVEGARWPTAINGSWSFGGVAVSGGEEVRQRMGVHRHIECRAWWMEGRAGKERRDGGATMGRGDRR
jgi:hypothetical protein